MDDAARVTQYLPTSNNSGRPPSSGYRHLAATYHGEDRFLEVVLPFVTAGLDAAEVVAVALPRRRVDLMRRALGRRAESVTFKYMEEIGRNPARIIPEWRRVLQARPADGRPVRGVGEPIWVGRSAPELDECHLHEALLNEAFADDAAFTLMCPYDSHGLPADTLAEAMRTHPHVRRDDTTGCSAAYAATEVRDRLFHTPLSLPPSQARELRTGSPQGRRRLSSLRREVADHAARCGLSPARADDLVLSVDEVVVNAVRHGLGTPRVRVWSEGPLAVCEVSDGGVLDDAMVGRVDPGPESTGGRGLLMVNRLCDLVQTRATPSGTVIRLHMGP